MLCNYFLSVRVCVYTHTYKHTNMQTCRHMNEIIAQHFYVCIDGFRRAHTSNWCPLPSPPLSRNLLACSLPPFLLPLSTLSPHLHSPTSWVDLLFFPSSAQSSVTTTTTTCTPPVLPLGLPHSTSCAGQGRAEQRSDKSEEDFSQARRERIDGQGKEGPWLLRLWLWRPGWYCRPCVWPWPKWWVPSGGCDVLYCKRCEGTRGPRWVKGPGGLLYMFLGKYEVLLGVSDWNTRGQTSRPVLGQSQSCG